MIYLFHWPCQLRLKSIWNVLIEAWFNVIKLCFFASLAVSVASQKHFGCAIWARAYKSIFSLIYKMRILFPTGLISSRDVYRKKWVMMQNVTLFFFHRMILFIRKIVRISKVSFSKNWPSCIYMYALFKFTGDPRSLTF